MTRQLGFGAELRALRVAAGLSLGQLADRVHFSKGHLSKVESGYKPPSVDLARLCDAELGADGRLVRLLDRTAPARTGTIPPPGVASQETWLLGITADGTGYFLPTDGSARPVPDLTQGMAFDMRGATLETDGLITAFLARFAGIRQLGQIAGPAVVLSMTIAETQVLRALARRASQDQRAGLWKLAARYAEYAGWMTQEAGDDAMATRWTQWAVRMAELAGDMDLRRYAMVRRAEIALHRDDARSTVQLAKRAQLDNRASTRVLGLAAQREAQGYALAGEEDACFRALERSATLLDAADEGATAGPPLGSTNTPDLGQIVLGWCLYELGQPDRAAEILDRCVARFAEHSHRARAKYGIRAALAYAVADELDRAIELTSGLLDHVRQVDSATIRHDLRGLVRVLRRRRHHRGVADLQAMLTDALHAPAGLLGEM